MLFRSLWSAPPTVKVEVEPLWLRVKGVSPAPRAATSERVEVQRFDVLVVLYELHEAQLVVFIHEVDDLVRQLFAVAASDGIVGVGAGEPQKSRLNCKKPEKSFYPRAARPSAKTSSADRKPRISRG